MKSIIIISSGLPDLTLLSEAYSQFGTPHLQAKNRLVVEGDWGWFAISIDSEIEVEFSDVERERVDQLIAGSVYAQLEYSTATAADLALQFMPTVAETLIDNDHGMLRPIAEVRELIRAGIEWKTSAV
jgi:hypothetical protein